MSSENNHTIKSSLGRRIKSARERASLTQEELALTVGIAKETLSKYENDHRTPDAIQLNRMINAIGCDPAWLLTGRELAIPIAPAAFGVAASGEAIPDYGNFVFVPQVSGEISAGGGLVADDSIEMRIAFRREWIQRRGDPQNMSLIRVSGDSMEPTLLSGDLVLVDHGRNFVDPQGGIYAIAMDDIIMIKRLQVIYPAKTLKIISDNSRYEPLETVTDQVRINGKVIWFGREIER